MHRRRAHPNALWPSNSGPSTPRRVRYDPGMSDIYGLDHVQIAMPAGGEDAARAFYGALLGLPEIPKPPDLATRGGVWFMLRRAAVASRRRNRFSARAQSAPRIVDVGFARTA
jgi:hypothetical protein